MNEPYTSGEYIYRDARPEDKAEVLALTANTWDFGDYIEYVFDDWQADQQGRFLVAEEQATGRIVAIDKLTMLSPTEAWFEGLRVHPNFRGRGLAGRLQSYMIGEAARLGARSVRLITLATNRPIHLAAYRDGFSMKGVVRFWKWEDSSETPATTEPPFDLRYATPDEATRLYEWWQRAAAFRTAGLVHRGWSFVEPSPEQWQNAATEQRLLVRAGPPIGANDMPPPTALVLRDTNHTGDPIWVLSALTSVGQEWTSLPGGMIVAARAAGITEINGLLPDAHDVYAGLQAAGFAGDPDEDRLALFELSLAGKSSV